MGKLKDKVKSFLGKARTEGKALKGETYKKKYFSSKNKFSSIEEAHDAFEDSKRRLFNINKWSLPGPNAEFYLHNQFGQPIGSSRPSVGSYIKIILPGPGLPPNWVEVTHVYEDEHSAEFTVKPASDPSSRDKEKTDHFFREEARSTFRVELNGKEIKAFEAGIAEAVNNRGTESGNRKTINTLIAAGGWAFFQKIQWKNLTKYFVGI